MSMPTRPSVTEGLAAAQAPDTGTLLKATLRLYRAHALLFVGVVAALNVPLQLITLALTLTTPRIPPFAVSVLVRLPSTQGSTVALTHPLTAAHIAAFAGIGARAVVGFVLSTLVGTVTTAALAVVIARRREGRAVSIAGAYRAVWERLGALLGAFVWAAARFVVLFVLCPTVVGLVVFIYCLVAWALIPQVVMLEGRSAVAASTRSRRLLTGHWRRASNLFVVIVVLALALIGIPPVILAALLAHALHVPVPLLQGLLGIVIALFVQPFAAAATTTLYIDLTTRAQTPIVPAVGQEEVMVATH